MWGGGLMPRKQRIMVPSLVIRMLLLLAGVSSLLVLGVSDVTAQITFGAPTSYDVPSEPRSLASADLNGDGSPDIVVTTPLGVVVLMNKGDGTFTEPPALYAADLRGAGFPSVVAADLNGDSLPDVAFSGGGGIGVLLNRGDGSLAPPTYYASSTGLFQESLTVGDFYHDGHNHLALVEVGLFGSSPTMTIFRNQGNGTFAKTQQFGL